MKYKVTASAIKEKCFQKCILKMYIKAYKLGTRCLERKKEKKWEFYPTDSSDVLQQ